MKRSRTYLLGAVLLGIALAGVIYLLWPDQKTYVIAGPRNLCMLPIIAEERGFFEAEGVSCRFEPLQTGIIALNALHSGDIDFAVPVDVNIAFVKYEGASPMRIIATIQEKIDDAVLARRDHGISSPNDLRGKTIAYLPATTSHVFLWRYLQRHGIDFDDVNLRKMTPPAMEAAIVTGAVDAVSVWQPYRYNALKRLGDQAIVLDDDSLYTVYAALVVREDALDEHRDAYERVLRALFQAEEFARTNQLEAIESLSGILEMTPEALAATWDQYRLRVRLDDAVLATIEEEGEWIKATEKDYEDRSLPDFSDLLLPDILRDLDPNRIVQE